MSWAGLTRAAAEVKWREAQHPRDRIGRFAHIPGGGDIDVPDVGGGKPSGGRAAPKKPSKVQRDLVQKLLKHENVPDRIAAYKELSLKERDAMAHATVSVPNYVREETGGRGTWPDTGDIDKDIDARMDMLEARMADSSVTRLQHAMYELSDHLDDAGVNPESRRELTLTALDYYAAQEIEANARVLGDHGVRHLIADAEMANDVLDAMPGKDKPDTKALMYLAGAFHDAGYLAPPSRAFVDMEHPRHSTQNYDANLKDMVVRGLGKKNADLLSHIVETHADTDMDWDKEPEAAAFRLADNMALFHREKLPGFMYHVPANTREVIAFGRGDIDLAEAKKRMLAHTKARKNLKPAVRKQILSAISEFTPMTAKTTVGQLGGKIDGFGWNKDHPVVKIHRSKANEAVHKVLDVGQRQFVKLAETYGADLDDFKRDSHFSFGKGGKTMMEIQLSGPQLKALLEALAGAGAG